MWFISVYVPWALGNNVYSLMAGVFYKYWLDPIGWWHCRILCPCWFSVNFWERGIEFSYYNCRFVFLFSVQKVLASYILQLCCLVHLALLDFPGGSTLLYNVFIVISNFLRWRKCCSEFGLERAYLLPMCL